MLNTLINWFTFVLALGLFYIVIYTIRRWCDSALAKKGLYKTVGISAYIGTPIHELGHYLVAKLFFFKVTETKFFPTSTHRDGNSVVLGYVNMQVPQRSIFAGLGMFLVGIAPIFSGLLAILGVSLLLYPSALYTLRFDLMSVHGFLSALYIFPKVIISSFRFSITYLIYAFLVICIGSHMVISSKDVKTASTGLIQLTGLILILSLLPLTRHFVDIAILNLRYYMSILFGLCTSLQLLRGIYVLIRVSLHR